MKRLRRLLGRLLVWCVGLVVAFHVLCAVALAALRLVHPPTTAVQVERRLGALLAHRPYHKRYQFVPLARISPDLQHAVISAEDVRFYHHHGIDWTELREAAGDAWERERLGRGASTITQQLVKNLFLSTRRALFRKGLEFTLAPMAEAILGKRRILELYLNVVEWGPGIWGAQAAAERYYAVPAARVGREQAARMAACLPAPLHRKPAQMNDYGAEILTRMRAAGW
jgi:monofunctional biosynthetic peptidoglycan transglycosylase